MTTPKKIRLFPRRARSYARRIWRDRKGSLVVIFALSAPIVIGAVGIGVESGIWYANKRTLQTQADAAALSGAFERAKGRPTNVTTAALREATRNGFVNSAPNTATVHNPPSTGPNTAEPEAVEVLLGRSQSLLMASFFMNNMMIAARAVAAVQTTGQACVLALDPTMSSALSNTGDPTINMAGCVMAANSTNSSAINITGSVSLTAESLWTAGGYTNGGSASVTLNTPAVTNAWALDDPYADKTVSPIGGCDHNHYSSNATETLNPGVYCNGFSLQAQAVITLNPGTYYIDGGDFTIQGGARIRCNCTQPHDGVTIVMTSSGNVSQIGTADIRGGADIVLNAPTDGTYAGLVFFQDPRAASGSAVNKFNGGATMSLTGAIYSRNEAVQYAGNNGSSGSNCTQIVAKQIVFTGHSTVNNSGCPAAGVEPLKIVGVKVVE